MNSVLSAIIPAAGASTRMGSAGSKTLLKVGGRSALERVVEALAATAMVRECVVAVPADQRAAFAQLNFGSMPVTFVDGGSTRQESVRRALEALAQRGSEKPDFVLVHDAARCLLTADLAQRVIAAAFERGAVTAAIPFADSVVEIDATSNQARARDRSALWAVQTPQVFRYDLLWRAHELAVSGATDDASLVERVAPVFVVPGSRHNFKLTTPEDYELAEALVQRKLR